MTADGTGWGPIRLIALDVDGTLTDGSLLYAGDDVIQRFSSRDGAGIIEAHRAGLKVALVSFRDFPATRSRAADLGVPPDLLHLGCADKASALRLVCARLGIPLESALFMGDDLVDIPAIRIAGIGACPASGHRLAREAADHVTSAAGGDGAVREVIDLVLEARNGG
jgi:3-deoxy-D-manno-octulosonate 8-phosphate phosphatase (KDO 8-P phosphatase)